MESRIDRYDGASNAKVVLFVNAISPTIDIKEQTETLCKPQRIHTLIISLSRFAFGSAIPIARRLTSS